MHAGKNNLKGAFRLEGRVCRCTIRLCASDLSETMFGIFTLIFLPDFYTMSNFCDPNLNVFLFSIEQRDCIKLLFRGWYLNVIDRDTDIHNVISEGELTNALFEWVL